MAFQTNGGGYPGYYDYNAYDSYRSENYYNGTYPRKTNSDYDTRKESKKERQPVEEENPVKLDEEFVSHLIRNDYSSLEQPGYSSQLAD